MHSKFENVSIFNLLTYHDDVVPDILVVGKPLGNGYPMAMVVTSKDIADKLSDLIRPIAEREV